MRRRTEVAAATVGVIIAAVALLAYFKYGSGTLEIRISDPPRDWGEATQVYINCSAIEIHRAEEGNDSGWSTVVEKSVWINLTRALDVGQSIGYGNLQAGRYNLIRFRVLGARVTVDGKNYSAQPPSDKLMIVITDGGVQLNTGQTATLLIDINVKVEGFRVTENFRLKVPTLKARQA